MSTFFFALMNVCIKKVTSVPAMEVVFFRCGVSMLLCFALLRREKVDWKGSNRLLLLLRGTFGTIALVTFFMTLQKMDLGTAVTIQYLSPIFTTIIAIFLLKEHIKPLQWLFFIISFSGVLVIKGVDSNVEMKYLIIGIISALASGFAYNMVRSMKEKEHPMVVVLHFQLVGFVVGAAFTIFQWVTPSLTDLIYLILIGILTQLGQVNLTHALNAEKVANVTILNYLGILYALIFGFFVFNESYHLGTIGGILLVVSGIILNFLYTRRQIAPVDE
jgi:drug/metabolite transporter (DMT)-like permease